MKEVTIEFDNKGPASINDEINIQANLNIKDTVEYKFIEGFDKVWTPIQDFSEKSICKWVPSKPGKYMILVQGKSKNSTKPYDCLGRAEYEIKEDVKLIKSVDLDKNKVKLGEKVQITVNSNEDLLLYRFWIRGKKDWEPLRDYETDNKFIYTAIESGTKEILIESKRLDSDNNVDDYCRVKIEVNDLGKVEIKDFKCLSNNLVVNEELVFRVETDNSNKRQLLYKFIKILNDGRRVCVKDFSSNNTVAFREDDIGENKLLCLVRDVFSTEKYDDRACIIYNVKPYEKVEIRSFKGDLASPQASGSTITLNAIVEGGREIVYRYIIEGPICEDSGYIRNNKYFWTPSEEGQYNITLKAKDISCKSDFEDIRNIVFTIDKKGERPAKIIEIKSESGKRCLVGHSSNITVKAEGSVKTLYKFIVYKDGIQKEEIDYGVNNWVNFIPEETGEYEIEARVKDYYSLREYDSSGSLYIKATDFIPAEIDYILTSSKEVFIVNDTIEIEAIMRNTKDTMLKFVTKINGQEVENTDFLENKKIRIKPKCAGKYSIQIYAKNINSTEEYDVKREITVNVQEAIPVNSTKISVLQEEIKVGNEVNFEAKCKGGKDVCYEFYIMKEGNWVLVQEYSKKNYYSFIPFMKGEYKLLVLAKSFYKKIGYEDYDSISFNVL